MNERRLEWSREGRMFCDSAILRVLLSSARKKPGLHSQLLMLVLAATIPLSNVLMGHCEAIENPPEQEKSTGHGVHVFPSSTTPGSHIQSGGLCEVFFEQKSHSLVRSQGSFEVLYDTSQIPDTHSSCNSKERESDKNTELGIVQSIWWCFHSALFRRAYSTKNTCIYIQCVRPQP